MSANVKSNVKSSVTSVNKTLMVMAGGTGGHVYPAMAVADELQSRGWNVVWLATEGGMENRLIAGKSYAVAVINMKGVRGKGLLRLISLPFQLLKACAQSFTAIKKYQPNVVLGMGGFAAFPGGLMAWLMQKPLVIHEQNSVAGLTNKVLAKLAKKVLVAFPAAFKGKASLVGNPVRSDITVLESPEARFSGRTGAMRWLIVGGSLGAQALNDVVPKALALIPDAQRPTVIHQAGEKHIAALQANYQAAGVDANAKAFINDMAAMYAWADCVICRAGALTIAELSAAGVASVLVPFPFAVDDHQTTNAAYLVDAGAALLVQQSDLTEAVLLKILQDLSREKCVEMAIKARSLGKLDATKAVADICMELAL